MFNRNKRQIEKDILNYYVCCDGAKVVGACGISELLSGSPYGLNNLTHYQEILYLIVERGYQKQGIGTTLLKMCIEGANSPIIYEAWGENGINSKVLLEKCGFSLVKDLGREYYKNHGYCPFCCNRNTNCNQCSAEVWMKNPIKL
ncbi:MAG: GNAT family N-acetyltransferase [Clostridia bacterium]|nr:GNAT family N-acetyltransferase [Clostridia bacterium]